MKKVTSILLAIALLAMVFNGLLSGKGGSDNYMGGKLPGMSNPPLISMNDPNLVGMWHFDEGAGQWANDSSGNGNNAILGQSDSDNIRDPDWVTGKFGYALSYNKTDKDYVKVNTWDTFGFQPISLSLWVKTHDLYGPIIRYCNFNTGYYGYYLNTYNGNVTFSLRGNNGAALCTIVGPSIIDGEWHHIAVVDDGIRIKLSVDGNYYFCASTSISLTLQMRLYFGNNRPESTDSNDTINGFIDEIMIWNSAISNTQISKIFGGLIAEWHFDEGAGQCANDSSGNNNNGTLGNTDNIDTDDPDWIDGKSEKALWFNGTNDYVNIPHDETLSITENITIEAWVKPEFITGAHTIVRKGDNSFWLEIELSKVNGGFRSGGIVKEAIGSTTLTTQTWFFLTMTFNEETIKVYVNGYEDGTFTYSGAIDEDLNPLTIGAKYTNMYFFPGSIDEVSIWNRTLTPAEIQEHFNDYLISREPIRINSNSEFNAINGVTGGNGTEGNPWIIENYDINGTGYGYCIYVGNTTEYFVVRDCYLHDASDFNLLPYYGNQGVILYNVSNCSITCLNISDNDRGIFLYNSHTNLVEKNIISRSFLSAVDVIFSNNNNISGNNVSTSSGWGIYINSCKNNTITNNIAQNNWWGIALYESSSTNNRLLLNRVLNNEYGISLWYSPSMNLIAHNLINYNTNQAYDDGTNQWDNGYPSGGNYWNDYTGTDTHCGAGQNQPGRDGIGDDPYNASTGQGIQGGTNVDNYPLMTPSDAQDIINPVSSINQLSSYWHNSSVMMNATASDTRCGVANVKLYYRHGTDNVSWMTGWEDYQTDTITPWNWMFDFPQGDGYYEFYSVANDLANNSETAPPIADTLCAHDATAPEANAGPDKTVNENTIVTFDGSGSSDAYGIINYTWTFDFGGHPPIVTLYGISPSYNFTTSMNYTITLEVTDYAGNWDIDTLLVKVEVPLLDTDGDGIPDSEDPDDDNDGFLDEWEEFLGTDPKDPDDAPVDTDGDGMPDGDGTNSQPWMDTDDDGDGIPDSEDPDYDTTPPVADAGINMEVVTGSLVTFDGSDSSDNIGITNYTWTFTYNGSQATLYGVSPQFTFWTDSNYSVTLTVFDGAGNSDTDVTIVRVFSLEDNVGSGSFTEHWQMILIIAVICAMLLVGVGIKRIGAKAPEFEDKPTDDMSDHKPDIEYKSPPPYTPP